MYAVTLAVIQSNTPDIRFAADRLRANIGLVAKVLLNAPELPLRSPCSTCLAPYYSATNSNGLLARLTDLVNGLGNAKPDDEIAKRIIQHIDEWSDGSYQTQKELLLLSIEKRSQFAFDVIYWINIVTKLLIALSNAPACPRICHGQTKKKRRVAHLCSFMDSRRQRLNIVREKLSANGNFI